MNIIKKKVSGDRVRFTEGNFNLDLAYITKNVIAMAIPAKGFGTLWRNNIDEVSEMLKQYHENNYMIWNLSEIAYDYQKFDQRILEFGFPDHHNPPIDLLFNIVLSMDAWLKKDSNRVAVVHCVGGKGRTGTVISSYLLYTSQEHTDPLTALNFFAEKRSLQKKGVTQPSQRRYVTYFHEVLVSGQPPYPRPLILKRITFASVPDFGKNPPGMNPFIKIYQVSYLNDQLARSVLYETPTSPEGRYQFYPRDPTRLVPIDLGILVAGDVLIVCEHANKKRMFRCSFHTAFIDHVQVVFSLQDLDDTSKNIGNFLEDFKLILMFELPPSNNDVDFTLPTLYEQVFSDWQKVERFDKKRASYTYYDTNKRKLKNSILRTSPEPPPCLLPLTPKLSTPGLYSSTSLPPDILSLPPLYSTYPTSISSSTPSASYSSSISSSNVPINREPSPHRNPHSSSPPIISSSVSPRRGRSPSPQYPGRIASGVHDIQWILSQSKRRQQSLVPLCASITPPAPAFTDPQLPSFEDTSLRIIDSKSFDLSSSSRGNQLCERPPIPPRTQSAPSAAAICDPSPSCESSCDEATTDETSLTETCSGL
eukprot:TRINITY_DN2363_c0_g1_i1.p1 TRINITY_DN2363_c0_g1~~TRINITY_DN2363_c0_g1_i1.p1  ORF type:complete len:592 (+),score=102.36 TRINITY_DN2363_c0_g1_i1:71-1846(+)